MPIYEYRCTKGHTFDVMQRFSDDPLSSCEACGAPAQRVLHAPAVHFKGSGFYNTDYGTRNRSREKEGSGGEGSSEGKSSSESGSSSSDSSGSGGSGGSSESGGSGESSGSGKTESKNGGKAKSKAAD